VDLLTHTAFEVSVCQATIFTPDEELSAAKVMGGFYPNCLDLFDSEPEVRPSLPGFPAEVPRIILKNKLDSMRLEIAAARTNFFLRKTREEGDSLSLERFYQEATRLFSQYQELTGCRVGRSAAVVTRFGNHDTPALFLSRHFCRDRWIEAPLDRPESFELHARKRFELADKLMVNSWVRNKTGYLAIEESKTPIVLVEQDINTLAEEAADSSFTPKDIELFFNLVE